MTTEDKRRRSEHQPTGRWITKKKRAAIYERDQYRCQRCGKDLTDVDPQHRTLDHIKRIADGGDNEPSNLITCCKSCNSGAKNRLTEKAMADKAKENSMTKPDEPKSPAGSIRDRIVDFKKMDASELVNHPMNYRNHSNQQKAAFRGILREIGKADTLLAYYSERLEGKLCVIDGHMRKNDFGGKWGVVITDLNDAEADKLLQAHDPIGQMADHDYEMLDELRAQAEWDDASVSIMLDGIDEWYSAKRKKKKGAEIDDDMKEGQPAEEDALNPVPEMELQPYEHYDYILVLATTTHDWNWLCDRLGIQKVNGSTDPHYKKVGLGRAIAADRLIGLLKAGIAPEDDAEQIEDFETAEAEESNEG